MPTNTLFQSRAVNRLIEAGNTATCTICRLPVKFRAQKKLRQVIANVYDGKGVWLRVEHYHPNCYEKAEKPYGEAK